MTGAFSEFVESSKRWRKYYITSRSVATHCGAGGSDAVCDQCNSAVGGEDGSLLPAWQLAEMGTTEVDTSFRLIKQPVGIGIRRGVRPMNPRTKIVGNSAPIYCNRSTQAGTIAWMQFIDGVASHVDLLSNR